MKNIEEVKEILLSSNFEDFKDALNHYNIHEQDKFGNNIFHYYIKESKELSLNYRDIIDVVLSKGLDINDKQSKGAFKRSPLHLAVFMKLKNVVEYLIELGADINSTDANGSSILGTAVMWYRDQDGYFIEKLIESGADSFLENNHGVSAFSLAQTIGNSDVKKFFNKF